MRRKWALLIALFPVTALASEAGRIEVKGFNAESYRETGEITFTVDVRDDSGPVEGLEKAQWLIGVGEPNARLKSAEAQPFRAAGGVTSVLVVLAATGNMTGQDEAESAQANEARGAPPIKHAWDGIASLKPALGKKDKLAIGCYDETKQSTLVGLASASSVNVALSVDEVIQKCRSPEAGGGLPRLKTALSNMVSDWLGKNKEIDRAVVVVVTDGNSKEPIDPEWWRPLQAKAGRAWLELYVVGLVDGGDPAKIENLAKGGVLRRAETRMNLTDEVSALAQLISGTGLYRVKYVIEDAIKGPDVALTLAAKDSRGLFKSDPYPVGQLQRKSSWLRIVILVAAVLIGAVFLVLLVRYIVAAVAESRRRREEEAAAAANQQYEGPTRGKLIVRDGPARGQIYPLIEDLTYIGRSQENQVAIPDKTVSKRHASIKIADRTYIIEDLQSVAGVYVNGQKVVKAHLKDGDSIRLGSTEMQFKLS